MGAQDGEGCDPGWRRFADGIAFLAEPGKIAKTAKGASEWVKLAIQLVRDAAEPNPWKNADDEAIAGEILRKLEERKRR